MIIRKKHNSHFTILPNSIHDGCWLSLEATGLLSFLISRPPNWEIRHDALRRKFRITRDRLGRILKELIRAGYLSRDEEQPRDASNRFAPYDYVVRDEPLRGASDAGRPLPDPRGRKPGAENKKEDIKNSKNKFRRNMSTAPGTELVGHQDSYSEFGRRALAAGMKPVIVDSKPFNAWLDFRGGDGMPLIDCAVIGGKSVQVVWMTSLFPRSIGQ